MPKRFKLPITLDNVKFTLRVYPESNSVMFSCGAHDKKAKRLLAGYKSPLVTLDIGRQELHHQLVFKNAITPKALTWLLSQICTDSSAVVECYTSFLKENFPTLLKPVTKVRVGIALSTGHRDVRSFSLLSASYRQESGLSQETRDKIFADAFGKDSLSAKLLAKRQSQRGLVFRPPSRPSAPVSEPITTGQSLS